MAARARCERVRIAESECRRQQLQAYLQRKGKLEVLGHTGRYYLGDQTNRKVQQRPAPFKVGMGGGQKHNISTTHSTFKGRNNPECTNRIKSLAARNQIQCNSKTTENNPTLTKTVPMFPQVMNADETTQSRQCVENLKPGISTYQFSRTLSNEEEKMKHTIGVCQIAGQSAGTVLIKLFTRKENNARIERLKETTSNKYSWAISVDNVAGEAPGGAKSAAPSRGALSGAKPMAPSRGASGRTKPVSTVGESKGALSMAKPVGVSRGAPSEVKLGGGAKGAFSRAKPAAPSRGAPGGPKPAALSRGAPGRPKPAALSRGAPGGPKPAALSRGAPSGPKPAALSRGAPSGPKPVTLSRGAPGKPKPAALSRGTHGRPKPAALSRGAPGRPKPAALSRGAPGRPKPAALSRGAPGSPNPTTLSRGALGGANLPSRFRGTLDGAKPTGTSKITLVQAKSGEYRGAPGGGKPASAAVKSTGRLTIPKEPSKAKMEENCGTFGKTEQKFESDNTRKSSCRVSLPTGPNSAVSSSVTIWKPFSKSEQKLHLVLSSPPRRLRKSKGAVQNLMESTKSAMSTVKCRNYQSSITKTFKGKDERRKQLEEWLASKGKTYKRPPMPTPLKRVVKSVKKNLEHSFLEAMEEENTLAVRVEHMLDNCMKLLERPVEELRSALVEAIMRNASSCKAWTEKKDVKTGGFKESDTATPRSTVVTFLCDKTDGHGSSVIKYRVTATPQVLRTNECQNGIQSAGQQSLKYLTPVRRSTRIEHVSASHPEVLREHDHCVHSLNDLLAEEGAETFLYKENRALLAE
ncbi:cytoskeleton-associated protein 2-like isoform X2 [Narcine bancroftii]|uniref:cytoskeleton-associated protein 2-like isoform X2 n=1 Tax=Narcine bancroftii TaxID=1343680 RepID=UPI00383165E5